METLQQTFKVGDKAVYPAHGVGEVTGIEKKDIGGATQVFYILKILDNGMKIMVPMLQAQRIQQTLADVATEIESARLLVQRAAWMGRNGVPMTGG